jgi:predicted transcriptional regulator
MRTTLDIDDDILQAVKELAAAQQTTAGQVLSDLARRALTGQAPEQAVVRNGFRLLPKRGAVVTSELVAKLAEDEP